ncbi:caspase family protein [Cellulomonas sp. ACRRI]|uniref:caspase family protein n=1 Tax=Cellulomonas sp. ACRRI TaxID=2918188 RepID=UPI001EF3CEDE|nr:caspase family protein [Cellulomonas sp. ACRRI]MCG7287492.1 caspase family protein [Cellulomonas sp. ACRRI]
MTTVARALVLVGVARTGGRFPELPAVPGAVAAVRAWATEQGVPDDLVLTFTDDDGTPVTSGAVLAGVRALVDRGDVDQLVVYFSGHGINTGNAEFWLLTGAPEDGSQAVNVSLTSWFAERLPVRHVVLVSDACRTAATTVQELSVQGVALVPNLPPRAPAAAVDVFYACALGDPAYEVKDPTASGAAYQALFTSALVGALRGDHPALVTPGPVADGDRAAGGVAGSARFGLVQPWPLKRALPGLVAERLTAAHAPLDLAQTPDARLSSDPVDAWLSRLEPWPVAPAAAETPGTDAPAERTAAPDDAAAPGAPPEAGAALADPDRTAREPAPAARTAAAEAADRLVLGLAVGLAAGAGGLPASAVGSTAAPSGAPAAPPSPARPPGPATAAPAVPAPIPAPDLEVAPLPAAPRPGGPVVVVQGDRALDVVPVSPTAVVVTFASGGCAVLPTLPGRVTLATVEHGRLVDCALPRTPGADAVPPPGADGAVARRALAAAWSRFGLRPDDDEDDDEHAGPPGPRDPADDPARAARRAVAVDADPLAALYRAWELHDRGRRAAIADLAEAGFPGARLFDVVLLASGPDPGRDDRPVDWAGLLTPVPLLSRGWPLLAAAPPGVQDRALSFPARLPSHWTLFAAENADRVAEVAAAAPAPDPPHPEEEP